MARACGLCLLLLMAGASSLAWRWLEVELAALRLQEQMQGWANDLDSLDSTSLALALQDGERGMQGPAGGQRNVRYLQSFGTVQRWASANAYLLAANPDDAAEVEALAARALDKHLAARRAVVRLQPSWPHGWMNLAYYKTQVAERDTELQVAFANAIAYGKNIETIQAGLADLSAIGPGLHTHDPALRSLQIANLGKALAPESRIARQVLSSLQKSRAMEVFCPLLKQEEIIEAAANYCATLGP